ncbi:glyoxylate dehydrogenase [Polyporus arcularius HHB13444]|uniref:L-lactate dehydrogenase (cytochrome) n=2 Tax=Polyporaceae TaxID=5317 RepID=A0A5C3PCV5_9APHY|nr:glyoxylate dehydrogenase [Polyporus brumalis]TFK87564.1 glyoxylate dehydrogenase [Polyporus arcularius HHB13444]
MSDIRVLTGPQVAEHASRESCWIIVHGKVYDVTDFLDEHPGGSKIILKYAGKDATEAYEPIHPPDAITTNLPPQKHLGVIDASTVAKVVKEVTEEEKHRQALLDARPPLDNIINLHDFENVAKIVLPEKAWAYYSSASDDEITIRENRMAYQRVWWRPRILRDVSSVDWSTTILGQKSTLPVYISATALGKLGHPDGELCLTRAAANHGVIQMIATLASCSFDDIIDAAAPGQVFFLQLYVNRDREITRKYVQHAEKRGVKGLFITVDAPQLGRREKDMRMKHVDDDAGAEVQKGQDGVKKDQGVARAISSFIDPSLSWKDIPWFKSITKMPIILKGIGSAEDAVLAYEAGVQGIVLSNHGGRQLDTARSGIEVLVEVVTALRLRGYFPDPKFEIYVDGGVRRASDVLKAIALGAKAVGVGRPFLYAFCAYGQEGVEKAIQIFRDEFEMNMRLLGARTIDEVVPDMVDASSLKSHFVMTPQDNLFTNTYQPLALAQFRNAKL